MFRTDSPRHDSAAPSVCLVAPAGAGLEQAVAAAMLDRGQSLAAAGWNVHLLWCGRGKRAPAPFAAVQWHWNDFDLPETLSLDGPCLTAALYDSDRVLHALRKLHDRCRFTVIQFPERGGLGFRCVQAKQTGQAFDDVRLCALKVGRSAEARHAYEQWPNAADLTLDYLERYTLEHADPFASSCTIDSEASDSQPLVTVCVPYFNLPDELEEALTSLAMQSYPNLEVLIINDGSTDACANEAFAALEPRFAEFRFLRQANAGIGATRNRGLRLARGEYFLPMDADNIADRDMVRRFVQGMQHNPDIAALSCYFLAFEVFVDLVERRFLYAYKPAGGPRLLGCWQNVYGDGNAIFRTEALRAVGGFETDRDTSFEDWEVFVKLANDGCRVDVLPDFLFYYRHRNVGFSRATSVYANRQRVLRRFREMEYLSACDRELLWDWLVGSQQRLAELEMENTDLKAQLTTKSHRMADGLRRTIRSLRRAANLFSSS